MSVRTVPVGLLGFGLAGSTFHAPLIAAVPDFAITHVMTSRTAAVARALPGAKAVAGAAEIFDDPAIELVVIATPNPTHADLARQALAAGKHVVIDKPMTTSRADADALIALAARNRRLLCVYQNRRWDGDFLTLRQLIETGRLGRVYSYHANYDRYRPNIKAGWREEPEPGSGLLFDLGSHLIDQALVLFGMPHTVTADLQTQRAGAKVVDYFHIVLGYGERRAIVHASTLVCEPGPHFAVHGDGGSFIKYGMDTQEASLKAGQVPGAPGFGSADPAFDGTLVSAEGSRQTIATLPGAYIDFFIRMAAAITGGGPVPVAAAEARDVITVIELAERSSAERRTLDA